MAPLAYPQKFIRTAGGILHRRVRVTTAGSAGVASGVGYVAVPPGRVVAVGVDYHASAPATSDLTLVADGLSDGTGGQTILTLTNTNTDITTRPVGTTALNSSSGATAATDGFSGGFPARAGLAVNCAQFDALTDAVIVDIFYKPMAYVAVDLVAQSGADGTGAVTQRVDFARAGRLLAVAIDYQNTPATADLIIKADDTSGQALFTRNNSNTDLNPTMLGSAGQDEGGAATAATDGTENGLCFKGGLFFDLAQTDIFTGLNEHTIVECWVDA